MRDARTRRQELRHAARDERDTWLWPARRLLAAAGRDLLAIRGLARHLRT